jgi:hypothetical protein
MEKLTFFEEGPEAMERELETVVSAWGDRPGFGGVAIHHYRSFRRLVEGR